MCLENTIAGYAVSKSRSQSIQTSCHLDVLHPSNIHILEKYELRNLYKTKNLQVRFTDSETVQKQYVPVHFVCRDKNNPTFPKYGKNKM